MRGGLAATPSASAVELLPISNSLHALRWWREIVPSAACNIPGHSDVRMTAMSLAIGFAERHRRDAWATAASSAGVDEAVGDHFAVAARDEQVGERGRPSTPGLGRRCQALACRPGVAGIRS